NNPPRAVDTVHSTPMRRLPYSRPALRRAGIPPPPALLHRARICDDPEDAAVAVALPLQHAEQLLVRLAEADRDPEMAGEAHVGAVSHEQARPQELVPERHRVGDLHEQEVRLRRRERVATLSQPLREERALFEDEPPGLVPVLGVLE